MPKTVALVLLIGCAIASASCRSAERRIVAAWLADHPSHRLASDVDCQCSEQLRQIRELDPGYQPYYVRGDFNRDGFEDLAVVVLDATVRKSQPVYPFPFELLIFNGPLVASAHPKPAFVRTGLQLQGQTVLFDRTGLDVGEQGKDGVTVEPAGATYSFGWPIEFGLSRRMPLVELLVLTRLAVSKVAAEQLVVQRRVEIDGRTVSENEMVASTIWLSVRSGQFEKAVFVQFEK